MITPRTMLRLPLRHTLLGHGIGILISAFVLLVAEKAAGDMVSVSSSPLSNFVIFSGGGANYNNQSNYETRIGGHTTVTGNIGSNQDLTMIGGQDGSGWAQVNGSVYVGGYLNMGQPLTFGNVSLLGNVVVNGTSPTAPSGAIEADITGTIYGNLYTTGDVRLGSNAAIRKVGGLGGNVEYTGNYNALSGSVVEGTATAVASTTTFPLISMPAATNFTAGGANQVVSSGSGVLTLAPDTYGTLTTSQQNQTVNLSSGEYYFDAISAQGGFTLNIDLTSGQPVSIYVVGDATFAQHNTLMVKGAGTGGAFVPISSAQSLASLIYLETRSRFIMGGATAANRSTWGGTVYASLREDAAASGSVGEVQIGQYMDWYGAVYAFDSVDIADHGTWNYVPIVPEPTTLALLALGGLALLPRRWR